MISPALRRLYRGLEQCFGAVFMALRLGARAFFRSVLDASLTGPTDGSAPAADGIAWWGLRPGARAAAEAPPIIGTGDGEP